MAAVSTATTDVRFGRLQFATTRSHRPNATPHTTCHLALTLAAVSAELHWCPAASAVLTNPHVPAARVVGLVRAGRLWIGSGGRAVELVVHVQVTDDGQAAAEARRKKRKKPAPRPPPAHFLNRLAEAVTEWSGWEDELGLTVRRSDGGETGEATESSGGMTAASNTLRFLVSKPATPGGLCAPPVPASYGKHGGNGDDGSKAGSVGIPQAQLRRVVCRLVYDALPAEVVSATAAAETAALLREKKRKTTAKTCRPPTGGGMTARRPTRQQPLRTRRAIVPPPLSAVDLLTAEESHEEDEDNPNIPRWPGAVALIEAVLSTLVGVRRRRLLGVRPVSWTTVAPSAGSQKPASSTAATGAPRYLASTVSSDPYISLLDMAPAVWSAHYGQAVTAHAAFIPTLSRLLVTSATNAQGASLRQKASAMGGGDVASMMATIETRLHELVLKEVPALPPRSVVRRRCAAKKAGDRAGDKAGEKPGNKGVREQRGLDDQNLRVATSESWRGVDKTTQDGKTSRHMVLHPTPPPDESQDSDIYSICMDNLDAILATAEDDEEVSRDGGSEPDETGDYETDWREIEAWSELDGWPAGDDPDYGHGWDENDGGDTYEEGHGQWHTDSGEYEAFEQEAGVDPLGDYDSSYVDDDREDDEDIRCTGWQDVEDWQLEAWAAGGSVQHHGI